jgi:MarR family 2-MHQ and catechol resistance regulon transcriptional repressor
MTTARDRDSSAAGVWLVLARAYRSMAAFIERSIAGLGIGLSDFMILEALLHKGPLTMTAICEKVLLTNASMTAAVDRLQKLGYVERKANAEDGRSKLVVLTRSGEKLIAKLFAQHEKDIEEMMRGVSAAERVQLRAGLKTIGLAASAALLKES